MRFKLGDRVRLVSVDPDKTPYTDEMLDLVGEQFTITHGPAFGTYWSCSCTLDDGRTYFVRVEDLEPVVECGLTGKCCEWGCNSPCPPGDPASPEHYRVSDIEPIDAIEAWELGFCLGNVVKYVARHAHKGDPLGDLKKAAWYLDRAIKEMEK